MNTSRMIVFGSLVFALVGVLAAAEEPVAQRVEFKTDDGVTIVGDYYPPTGPEAAPAAILLHMYRQDRTTWKPLVGPLHGAGFAALAIDLRGHGESTKPEDKRLTRRVSERDPKFFNAMHRDVAAAVKWIRAQPDVDQAKLVLVGASIGCSVAIDYTTRDQSVDAVVCLTPGENYMGVDSTAHIKKTGDRPILLLATEDERRATDVLAKLAGNTSGEIVGKGRVHGTNMFGRIDGIEEKIAKFLSENVRDASGG